MNAFLPADILIPKDEFLQNWSVVACDQFTSDSAYWQRVRQRTEGVPSAMQLILPEAEAGNPDRIGKIHKTMEDYLEAGIFRCFPQSYVYVERRFPGGLIRQGLVGMVDLEQYPAAVRATEDTVLARIPPRQAVRREAALEISHVLLLCDDPESLLLGSILRGRKLYGFDLMEGGGRVDGWLVQGQAAAAFDRRLADYTLRRKVQSGPVLVVGDGNHSLAAAKSCYEAGKCRQPGLRYALAELVNARDPMLKLGPIHRLVTNTDPEGLLQALAAVSDGGPAQVEWVSGKRRGNVSLGRGTETVAMLQNTLDQWVEARGGTVDYLHDAREAAVLAAAPGAVALLLPAIEKQTLLRALMSGEVLPRKTFSMGLAREKRYYLEGRKLI